MDEPVSGITSGPASRYGPFAIATVTMSLLAWPIAFNFGAYESVFYDDIFQFVVAATAGLAVSLVTPTEQGPRLVAMRVVLAAPVGWLLMSVWLFDSTAEAAVDPLFGAIGLVIIVTSVPAVMKLLIDLFLPEASSIDSARQVLTAGVIVACIAVLGYVVGVNNDAFLVCDDFRIAGSDLPPNCAPG